MRVLVAVLALSVALTSMSAEAKTRKKKRHHKPKATQTSNAVQMDMEFEVNGALIATQHIAAELGKTAALTETSSDKTVYTIEVTPTKPKAGQVMMAFEISRNVDGRKEIIASPRLTTLSGEKARMEQKSESGTTMSIEVTAKL